MKTIRAPAFYNEGSSYATRVAQPIDLDDHITWDTGVAVVAAAYSIGRDADGTNQLHFNVPTGATYEFSVQDTVEMVLSATDLDLQSNTLSNIGAAGNDWTANQLSVTSTNVGGTNTIKVTNLDSGNAASHAQLNIASDGGGGGDAFMHLRIGGVQSMSMVLDNSNSDLLVWSEQNGGVGTDDRMRLVPSSGVLSVDGDGGGSDDPVSLFDEYDDAHELKRFAYAHPGAPITSEMREDNRLRMVEMGVADWAEQSEGPDHLMIKIQPMLRLLAGGIYQSRAYFDEQLDILRGQLTVAGILPEA